MLAPADLVEPWNVRRLELAAELAELRGVSWQWGIEGLNLTTTL